MLAWRESNFTPTVPLNEADRSDVDKPLQPVLAVGFVDPLQPVMATASARVAAGLLADGRIAHVLPVGAF